MQSYCRRQAPTKGFELGTEVILQGKFIGRDLNAGDLLGCQMVQVLPLCFRLVIWVDRVLMHVRLEELSRLVRWWLPLKGVATDLKAVRRVVDSRSGLDLTWHGCMMVGLRKKVSLTSKMRTAMTVGAVMATMFVLLMMVMMMTATSTTTSGILVLMMGIRVWTLIRRGKGV